MIIALHHFLTESPWTVQQLRQQRLELILKVLNGRTMILLIDETGDCKTREKYRLCQTTCALAMWVKRKMA